MRRNDSADVFLLLAHSTYTNHYATFAHCRGIAMSTTSSVAAFKTQEEVLDNGHEAEKDIRATTR